MSDYTMKQHKKYVRNSTLPGRWLAWRPCVGHRLAHRDCRIYTNSRWGVKVTVHVQTLGQWNLTLPDPQSLRRLAERGQRFMPEFTADTIKHYHEAQARVAKTMKGIYTPKFSARVKGVAP